MRSSIGLPGFLDELTDATFQQPEIGGTPIDSVWQWHDVVARGNDIHKFGTDALNLSKQVEVDTQLEYRASLRVAGQLCVDDFARTSHQGYWVYSLCRGSRHGRNRSRKPAAGRISGSRIGTSDSPFSPSRILTLHSSHGEPKSSPYTTSKITAWISIRNYSAEQPDS